MKKELLTLIIPLSVLAMIIVACSKDELEVSPSVPYNIELNKNIFCNGDSLFGKIVINDNNMVPGTQVKKIDCRLGNIVIGTTEGQFECPFGLRLKDKPLGFHVFSVIIKCQSPDCDETFWRDDYSTIVEIISRDNNQ